MEAVVKFLKIEHKTAPFLVVNANPQPGDLTFNEENELIQVNQSNCVWFDKKILGPVAVGVNVIDNETVTVLFKCAARENCNYPFCGKACPGNEGYYISGKEDRGY